MPGGSHKILLQWVGGEHEFALGLAQLRGLQDARNKGPERIFKDISSGDWLADDVIETLRFGLIGGGMTSKEAGPLVVRLYDLHSRLHLKEVAFRVLGAALIGVEDDVVGESRPAPEGKATGNGNSPVSTEPGQ